MRTTPFVSVCMITYNHEKFISQAIEGALMQETNFSFEILINDDVSTDRTAHIIKEYEAKYPNIIKPLYQTENQYSQNPSIPVFNNFLRAQGKYIALCEGDDYWTDPNKLQKQVDFLETHPSFSICSHRYKTYNEKTKEWFPYHGSPLFTENIKGIAFDKEFHFTKYWLAKTMTVMFRKEHLDLHTLHQYEYLRDSHLFYHLLTAGNGYCMNYDAAVYRLHTEGIWGPTGKAERYDISSKVFEELYKHNKHDIVLRKIILQRKFDLYSGFISFKYPFFNFNELKERVKRYSNYTKKPLILYPVFFVFYFVKRLMLIFKRGFNHVFKSVFPA